MKYIVFKHDEHGELLFAFPNKPILVHAEVAEMLRAVKIEKGRSWGRDLFDAEIVSAGFIDKHGNCFGKSESLDIKSRPDIDKKLFAAQGS